MFLGKISVGYTVRQFIRVNLLYTAIFGACWMMIFSGTTIVLEQKGTNLGEILQLEGAGNVVYGVLNSLGTEFLGIVFLLVAFLSYVTAADSNTSALGGISSRGISASHETASTSVKIVWGIVIGIMAFVMITMADVEGIKIISTVGGLPAMFLLIVVAISLLKLAFFKGGKDL